MIYDPALDLITAYENNLYSMRQINAHGMTEATLELNYLEGQGQFQHYSYNMGTSETPDINMICDSSLKSGNWCYATVNIRFSSMIRTRYAQEQATSPGDVFQSVGSYFALVQFVSWVVSGMALSRHA